MGSGKLLLTGGGRRLLASTGALRYCCCEAGEPCIACSGDQGAVSISASSGDWPCNPPASIDYNSFIDGQYDPGGDEYFCIWRWEYSGLPDWFFVVMYWKTRQIFEAAIYEGITFVTRFELLDAGITCSGGTLSGVIELAGTEEDGGLGEGNCSGETATVTLGA